MAVERIMTTFITYQVIWRHAPTHRRRRLTLITEIFAISRAICCHVDAVESHHIFIYNTPFAWDKHDTIWAREKNIMFLSSHGWSVQHFFHAMTLLCSTRRKTISRILCLSHPPFLSGCVATHRIIIICNVITFLTLFSLCCHPLARWAARKKSVIERKNETRKSFAPY